jgi:hypothetical protein
MMAPRKKRGGIETIDAPAVLSRVRQAFSRQCETKRYTLIDFATVPAVIWIIPANWWLSR